MERVRYTQIFVRKLLDPSLVERFRIIFRNVGIVHVLIVTRRFIQDFSYLNSDSCDGLLETNV